ncbi:hypothetical protein BDB01DRAFT_836822 [Pilobolus umbonatus]|nr:hypothetical protein BDB01DRAFT_836822 [Pilobolus umbonatus]
MMSIVFLGRWHLFNPVHCQQSNCRRERTSDISVELKLKVRHFFPQGSTYIKDVFTGVTNLSADIACLPSENISMFAVLLKMETLVTLHLSIRDLLIADELYSLWSCARPSPCIPGIDDTFKAVITSSDQFAIEIKVKNLAESSIKRMNILQNLEDPNSSSLLTQFSVTLNISSLNLQRPVTSHFIHAVMEDFYCHTSNNSGKHLSGRH